MADIEAVRSGFMTEMTPRERSELVRRQSRDYITALRQGRLKRTAVIAPTSAKPLGTAASAFRPSSQASARALEARAKREPSAIEAAAAALRDEAAEIRRTSAEALSQMRDARRPKPGTDSRIKAKKPDASERQGPSATIVKPASVESVLPAAVRSAAVSASPPSVNAAVDPGIVRTAPDPEPLAVAPQRRARPKRSMSSEIAPAASGSAGTTPDIDVITGLGPALKAKLRQSGITTVGNLAVQKPEHLREVLGPAGRLVNLEALVRAARTACGGTTPGAASPEGTRPASRLAPPRRSES